MLRRGIVTLAAVGLVALAAVSLGPDWGRTAHASEEGLPVTAEELEAARFPDVPETAVYRDAVSWAAAKGVLGGTQEGTFLPDGLATRAHTIGALYRLEQANGRAQTYSDREIEDALSRFSDVDPEAWYAQAVAWSVESGVSRGFTDGTFRPNALVNRQQLANLLYGYAQTLELSTGVFGKSPAYWDGTPDERMAWALQNDLFPWVTRAIRPTFSVSRAQLAQALAGVEALRTGDFLLADIVAEQKTELLAPAAHEELQRAVDAAAEKYHAAGVQVAIVEQGTVSHKLRGGWANKYDVNTPYALAASPEAATLGQPMTADDPLRVASLSKVVVGMTAMAMTQQGTLELNRELGSYWNAPGRNPQHSKAPITIRSLMTHTSSLAQMESASAMGDRVQDRLNTGKGYSGAYPGVIGSWTYNNYAFGVLGMTMEKSENRVLDQITGAYLMNPLQIDGSFQSGRVKHADRIATLYAGTDVRRSQEMQQEMTELWAPGADGSRFAGGFTASAADMGKLVAVLANDGVFEGRRVLWPSSVQAMETPLGTVTGGYPFEQGLVIRRQYDLYGRPSLWYHTGSAYGVYNFLSYDPATGDGVVVLTTGASGAKDSRDIYAICGQIAQAVYQTLEEQRAQS